MSSETNLAVLDYQKFLEATKYEDSQQLRKAFAGGWVSAHLATMQFIAHTTSPRDEDFATRVGLAMARLSAQSAILVGMPPEEAQRRLDQLHEEVAKPKGG